MSTKIEPDVSSIEELDFEIKCNIIWCLSSEVRETCDRTAEYSATVMSHDVHEYKEKYICKICLKLLLRCDYTWCYECNQHERMKNLRSI